MLQMFKWFVIGLGELLELFYSQYLYPIIFDGNSTDVSISSKLKIHQKYCCFRLV